MTDRVVVPSCDLDSQRAVMKDVPAQYQFPAKLPPGYMGLSGTWTIHAQEATAGAKLSWSSAFSPKTSTWLWAAPGPSTSASTATTPRPSRSAVPRLYTLYQAGSSKLRQLELHFSPGVQAYDFTFG